MQTKAKLLLGNVKAYLNWSLSVQLSWIIIIYCYYIIMIIVNYHPLVIIYSFPEHEKQNACKEKKILNGKMKASTF